MKKAIAVLSAVAMTVLSATTLSAAVTQQSVIGKSSHPVFTVKIRATNGKVYICKPETTKNNSGQTLRTCVREEGVEALFASGTGIGAGGAVAGGLLFAMLINNNSSGTTTTGSTDN